MRKKPNHAESSIDKLWSSARFWLITSLSVLLFGCEQTPDPVATWQHATTGSYEASISRDGRFALVSTVNHQAGLWDLRNNALLYQWRHNDNPDSGITATAFSPEARFAITADKRTFVIWNVETGASQGYYEAPADISAVALSRNAQHVLLGLRDGRAIHINLETGRRLEFTGHRIEPVASVSLSANGVWAFTGASDYRAVLWNTQTGIPRYVFEHETRVTLVELAPSGQLAFTSGTRGNAIIWDLNTGSEYSRLQLKPREYVTSAVAFSDDETEIATGAPGRDIRLWSTQTGEKLGEWKAQTRDQWKPSGAVVWAVQFDEDGQHLLTEASSGFGQKWLLPERQRP